MRRYFGLIAATMRLPIINRRWLHGRRRDCGSCPGTVSSDLDSDQRLRRAIINDKKREIGLARHRAETGELRRGEARHIIGVRMQVRHRIEHRLIRRCRQRDLTSQLKFSSPWPRLWQATPRASRHGATRRVLLPRNAGEPESADAPSFRPLSSRSRFPACRHASSTSDLASGRPRPVPSYLRSSRLSTCPNGVRATSIFV